MTRLRTVLLVFAGTLCGAALTYFVLPRQAAPQAPQSVVRLGPVTEVSAESARSPTGATRIEFAVTQEERAHIEGQMLTFLIDLQNLNSALSSSDRAWISDIANGQARPQDQRGFGRQLRAKAPEGFTQISQSLRSDFADLANASASEPVEELQERVSLIVSRCVACHGAYALEDAQPGQPAPEPSTD